MLVTANVMNWFATLAGLLAGSIAVGGFLAHIRPALSGASEAELREATVVGGTIGLGVGVFVVVLSAFLDRIGL